MIAKPTPDALDHFVEEVRKAHTPDDVLERQKWQEELADDVAFKFQVKNQKILDYIKNWQPRRE